MVDMRYRWYFGGSWLPFTGQWLVRCPAARHSSVAHIGPSRSSSHSRKDDASDISQIMTIGPWVKLSEFTIATFFYCPTLERILIPFCKAWHGVRWVEIMFSQILIATARLNSLKMCHEQMTATSLSNQSQVCWHQSLSFNPWLIGWSVTPWPHSLAASIVPSPDSRGANPADPHLLRWSGLSVSLMNMLGAWIKTCLFQGHGLGWLWQASAFRGCSRNYVDQKLMFPRPSGPLTPFKMRFLRILPSGPM